MCSGSDSACRSIKWWDLRAAASRETLTKALAQLPCSDISRRGICSLDVEYASMKMASSTTGGAILLHDLLRPEQGPHSVFAGHSARTFYVKAALSPGGRYVCSGSSDNHAYVYRVDEPGHPPEILRGHHGEVTSVDWSRATPPGSEPVFASCSDDGTVRLWKGLVSAELRPRTRAPSSVRCTFRTPTALPRARRD